MKIISQYVDEWMQKKKKRQKEREDNVNSSNDRCMHKTATPPITNMIYSTNIGALCEKKMTYYIQI